METHMPLEPSKRAWHIARVVFFMLRKGICKRKLMVDLNMMLKRGKIAGKAAINLISHHHHSHGGPHEYEFSCSSTPSYSLPWKTRKSSGNRHFHNLLFGCTQVDEDEPTQFSFDCQEAVEMVEKTDRYGAVMEILASPVLLRSPFPLKNYDGDDNYVDIAAEEFIANFYRQLRQQ